MLKCNRCNQYYIPGYLDCACRTISRSLRSSLSALPVITAAAGAAQPKHPIVSTPDAPKPPDSPITGERTNRSADM